MQKSKSAVSTAIVMIAFVLTYYGLCSIIPGFERAFAAIATGIVIIATAGFVAHWLNTK
jgi:Mg2+ and Co2+ transporter CorA